MLKYLENNAMSFINNVIKLLRGIIMKKDNNEWDLTKSLTLYKEFIDKKYYESADHTIPAEFVARCVKEDAIWLVNLLIGVCFYAVKFDKSTESYFSPELLKKAGFVDPCIKGCGVKIPWEQKTSIGKSPIDPKSLNETSGLGIANYDSSGLLDFYTAKKLTATLPIKDSDGNIKFDSNGNSIKDTKVVTFEDNIIRGWGLKYGEKTLAVKDVCWNPYIACIETQDGVVCLACSRPDSIDYKCVGASNSEKNLPYHNRKDWYAWTRYFLIGDGAKDSNNIVFPAAKWFCSYWSPYYAWGEKKRSHSIEQTMMLSSIANSSPSMAKMNLGKSVDQMIRAYATNDHRKRRVYNTQRAIAIVKYLKQL